MTYALALIGCDSGQPSDVVHDHHRGADRGDRSCAGDAASDGTVSAEVAAFVTLRGVVLVVAVRWPMRRRS